MICHYFSARQLRIIIHIIHRNAMYSLVSLDASKKYASKRLLVYVIAEVEPHLDLPLMKAASKISSSAPRLQHCSYVYSLPSRLTLIFISYLWSGLVHKIRYVSSPAECIR